MTKLNNSTVGRGGGFALVVTMLLLALLALLAVGMLGLASGSLRGSQQEMALAEARANARLGLTLALGELQKELGPDMRISVESAIFDSDAASREISGLAQSRWMASYNAWGDWLNAAYAPAGANGAVSIADTYEPRRARMFRRWLVSLPEGLADDVRAPDALEGWDDDNSVILVGSGSLGDAAAARPDQVTRARLVSTDQGGMYAWWIGPENHRAKVNVNGASADLTVDQWEASQGNSAEVAVGLLPGMESLDAEPAARARVASLGTLRLAGVPAAVVEGGFFDFTASSRGVLSSARTGGLKKDISLLFELPNDQLPERYRWVPGSTREPSIRPLSPDLLAYNPRITHRQFQSWTNMRHFYRMYRQDSEATMNEIGSSGGLTWSGSRPHVEALIPLHYRDRNNNNNWQGQNAYLRLPVLAKLTFIYSLKSERVNPDSTTDLRRNLYLVYTPVYTYWNPYNVELRIPDNTMGRLSSTYQVLPMGIQRYLGNEPQSPDPGLLSTGNAHSFLRSGDGGDIVFKPGELRVFSHSTIRPQGGGQADPLDLVPGFDPLAYGGDRLTLNPPRNEHENPGVVITFSHSYWGGNVSYGNTPGSLCHTPFWLPDGEARILAFNWNYPVMYQHDWFNLAQTYTPLMPPGAENVARWSFADDHPVPVAYTQLVLKGLSEFEHESIGWARDWRSRNWIQAPPFYFGSATYISEDERIAHTQRVDSPYVMNFGPMSQAEIPKVVFHVGSRGFYGSGANPFEKVNAIPAAELPTAPVGGLAGFAGMRINPGWADPRQMNPDLHINSVSGNNTSKASFAFAQNKTLAYQSGVTGPGIGNSFVHPMLPREQVYRFFNNSVSADPANRGAPLDNIHFNDNKVFSDFWDHVFLLNDALWDDYFVSSLADQTRPGASSAVNLAQNVERLVSSGQIANSRFRFHANGRAEADAAAALQEADGYLEAAAHLMVDGMFNVNSTSVPAWFALFAGIRERQAVYRDQDGVLRPIEVPEGKRIALTRFNTEVSDREVDDPEFGANLGGGMQSWTGVRYLSDDQLLRLAEECVRQVKLRGPFLNYSEFINRRLSNDELGLMGALQSAIDYDDASQAPDSINYRFKNGPDFMMDSGYLGSHEFATPEAMHGSRFAGIPGYVIQSDLLKPIANTLNVRDDTFRLRAYGESRDAVGKVVARAWCEVIVQRVPAYLDPSNEANEPLRKMRSDGAFRDNEDISLTNRRFGRRLEIVDFRWLHPDEV